MPDTSADSLLRYRAWRGTYRPPVMGSVAMARLALVQLARRKLFWGLYALALMIFFFFFYGQYLIVWIQIQTAQQTVSFGGIPVKVAELTKFLDRLNLNGSAQTFANFIWFQGAIVMIVLALAGAVLIGNDFHHGSLPFYLGKPFSRRHYLLGKALGIGLFVNLLTTLPAIALYLQAGLLYDWEVYYIDHLRELAGIVGYGLAMTVVLGAVLVATAVAVRRTIPLIMIWTGLFVFTRQLANLLVDGAKLDARWRLLDLWNDLYLAGLAMLGVDRDTVRPAAQPEFWEAFAALALIVAACLLYLRKRIHAVEVVG
jgi:ABC-type transport system involved in multi-copper enzyme maturation permease subunit